MHLSIMGYIGFLALAFLGAIATLFRRFILFGDNETNNGPRALIAFFIGLWLGFYFLLLCFSTNEIRYKWVFGVTSALVAGIGYALNQYFSSHTEISDEGKNVSGFKDDTTHLNLK